MRDPRGRKPKADPHIYDLCHEKNAVLGWAHPRIAEWLLHEHGIVGDHGGPVHRSTVLRWIRKGGERLAREGGYRVDVERILAARELDGLKELLFDFAQSRGTLDFEDTLKFVETALRLRDRRNALFGLNAPTRTSVTQQVEARIKPLDPQTDEMLSALEDEIAAERERRSRGA